VENRTELSVIHELDAGRRESSTPALSGCEHLAWFAIFLAAAATTLLLIAIFEATPAHAAERRVAILVGNDDGDPARDPLRWATRDAREMQHVLSTLAGVKTTHLLLDRDPDTLRATWTKVQDDLTRDPTPTTLFFFYSGHADDRGLLMNEGRYDFEELRRTLERLPIQLFVAVIDACQSGAVARTKGGAAVPVLDLDIRNTGPTQKGGIYITSSAFGEAAQESDEIEASYFTHYLVSGLRGAADDSGDRRVSLEEAYRFAYAETLKKTQSTLLGPQHPSWEVDVQGQGQLVLTWLDTAASYIVLPEQTRGRWFVRKIDAADVFAETEKRSGGRVRIAVEPGEYEVARNDGKFEHYTRFTVERGKETIVDERRLSTRPLELHARKGGTRPTESVSSSYRFAGGYLQDAGPTHALRIRAMRLYGSLELGGAIHYGQSEWERRDRLKVSLRELALGASFAYRHDLSRAIAAFGAADVLLGYVHEKALSVTLDSLVVPVDARAGFRLQLAGPIALELSGSLGGVIYRGPKNIRAVFTPGFEIALRAAP
jgi:hypothetical protein